MAAAAFTQNNRESNDIIHFIIKETELFKTVSHLQVTSEVPGLLQVISLMCAIYLKPGRSSRQPLGILQSSFGHLLFCSDRTVYSNYVHCREVSASHQNKYPETLILLLLLWTLDNGIWIWKLYSFDILIFDVLKVQYSARSIE